MNTDSENNIISKELNQWRLRLTTISRNLMDLAETESTKIIKVRLNDPVHGYMGLTQKKTLQALKELENLWQSYLLLARVIEEATDLAGKNGIFRRTASEVRELLEGPSVVLPTEYIPIIARELLADADKSTRVTPVAMLSAMQEQFTEVRDVLASIGQAHNQLKAKLTALEAEAVTLKNWSKALGIDGQVFVGMTDQILQIEADPLSSLKDADRLAVEMAKQRKMLEGIEQERIAIEASLAEGGVMVKKLGDLVLGSKQAITETQEKILQPEGLIAPMDQEIVESLQGWLTTLVDTAKAGRYRAVQIGFGKWAQECKAHLASEENNYKSNRFALEERADLKGRFKALSVKAQVLKSKGLVGDSLEKLSAEAQQVLAAQPFDINAGRRMVGAFEATLTSLVNSHH